MPTLTQGKDLAEGVSEKLFATEEWLEVTFLHSAETAGDLFLSATGKSSANGFLVPRNIQIGPLRIAPGTTFSAVSGSGTRRINWIATPLPWPAGLLERAVAVLEALGCVLEGMVR